MKRLLALISIAAPLFACEPKRVSPEQELILLRAILIQQYTQVELLTYRDKPRMESMQLRALEAKATEASEAWGVALTTARKADKADDCEIRLIPKAEWVRKEPVK